MSTESEVRVLLTQLSPHATAIDDAECTMSNTNCGAVMADFKSATNPPERAQPLSSQIAAPVPLDWELGN